MICLRMTSSVKHVPLKTFKFSYFFLLGLLFTTQANSANSYIEYSKMLHSDTLRAVNTLGFYTIFNQRRDHQYYAGIDLALFEANTASNNDLATRLAIGVSGTATLAPYAEIGTGLLDLLVRNNDSAQACDSTQRSCSADLYFRAGLRINATNHLSVGVFYEGVRFGRYQDELIGSHGYTGVNIGVRY